MMKRDKTMTREELLNAIDFNLMYLVVRKESNAVVALFRTRWQAEKFIKDSASGKDYHLIAD